MNETTPASEIVNTAQCKEQNELSDEASSHDEIDISEPFPQLHSQSPAIRSETLDRPMKIWAMEHGTSSRWRTPLPKHVEKEAFHGDRRMSDATIAPHDGLLQFDCPEAVISIIDSVFTGSLAHTDHKNALRTVQMDRRRLESDGCCLGAADVVKTPFIGRREVIERISKRDNSRRNFGLQLSKACTVNPVLLDDDESASNRPSDVSSWRYLNPEALALQAKETAELSYSGDLNAKVMADSNGFSMKLRGKKTFYEI
uniref:Uncharacterized protein n=1 Tax=Parascaris univalens TaxID=6257 RepID=A0A915ANF5_PARUN